MIKNRIHSIAARLVDAQAVTSADLRDIHAALGEIPYLTRDEAQSLITVERMIDGRCEGWEAFLTEALVAHLVWEIRPSGRVPRSDAEWLIDELDQMPERSRARARRIARAVICEAESADEALVAFALGADAGIACRAPATPVPAWAIEAIAC
jgi:hypothetical protein